MGSSVVDLGPRLAVTLAVLTALAAVAGRLSGLGQDRPVVVAALRATHSSVPDPTGGRVLAAACPTPLLSMSAGHGGLLHRPMDELHRWLLRHCTSPMAFVPPVHRVTGEAPREEVTAVR